MSRQIATFYYERIASSKDKSRVKRLLADAHPFRIAIVCAMWLTGFDVPSLSALYLDKPLKAHTLMQAIARANRVNEGKNNGLIVDYCGILKNLRQAMATFATNGGTSGGGGDDPVRPPEERSLRNKGSRCFQQSCTARQRLM